MQDVVISSSSLSNTVEKLTRLVGVERLLEVVLSHYFRLRLSSSSSSETVRGLLLKGFHFLSLSLLPLPTYLLVRFLPFVCFSSFLLPHGSETDLMVLAAVFRKDGLRTRLLLYDPLLRHHRVFEISTHSRSSLVPPGRTVPFRRSRPLSPSTRYSLLHLVNFACSQRSNRGLAQHSQVFVPGGTHTFGKNLPCRTLVR